jgi:hypothetical protein
MAGGTGGFACRSHFQLSPLNVEPAGHSLMKYIFDGIYRPFLHFCRLAHLLSHFRLLLWD